MEALAESEKLVAPQYGVCVWRLESTTITYRQPNFPSAPTSQTSFPPNLESVFVDDGRTRVAPRDYKPGGKYEGQLDCFDALEDDDINQSLQLS